MVTSDAIWIHSDDWIKKWCDQTTLGKYSTLNEMNKNKCALESGCLFILPDKRWFSSWRKKHTAFRERKATDYHHHHKAKWEDWTITIIVRRKQRPDYLTLVIYSQLRFRFLNFNGNYFFKLKLLSRYFSILFLVDEASNTWTVNSFYF